MSILHSELVPKSVKMTTYFYSEIILSPTMAVVNSTVDSGKPHTVGSHSTTVPKVYVSIAWKEWSHTWHVVLYEQSSKCMRKRENGVLYRIRRERGTDEEREARFVQCYSREAECMWQCVDDVM